jgi:hypothetical protein
MAVISFSDKPEEVWGVAGWAFRQILEDVLARFPNDSEMRASFEFPLESSGLCVELLPPELAGRVTNAIRQVAEGILDGTIRSGIADKPYGAADTVGQYHEGLRTLLKAIPSPKAS